MMCLPYSTILIMGCNPLVLFSHTYPSLLIAVVTEPARSSQRSSPALYYSRNSSGNCENDMLQYFIDSKYKDGRSTTEAEVTGLLTAALFAGQHTSSITSTWTGAYLLRYKVFLSAVVEEQRTLMQKHGENVDHDVLSEMEVLHRCIKEALRLHPPLIVLLRQSHSDFSVTSREGKEYDIPKGHIVATSPAFSNLSLIYTKIHIITILTVLLLAEMRIK